MNIWELAAHIVFFLLGKEPLQYQMHRNKDTNEKESCERFVV